MAITPTAFHWRYGWSFDRDADGSVRVVNEQTGVHLLIPPAEWASIVAHVAPGGGTAEEYAAAASLHGAPPEARR